MLTSTADLTGPHRAARRSWLLLLLVLGILGMHGLVAGTGTTGSHHVRGPGHAAAASVAADAGHASHAAPGPAATVVDDEPGTALALCLVLLMALGTGLLVARSGSWSVRPVRLPVRVRLPEAPLLRDSTPVPRFTVMRC